jgi:hypothetical protein
MNDDGPLDLKLLDPEDSPDVVTGAIRRFRWQVVLFTVAAVIVAVSLTVWGVASYLESKEVASRSRQLPAEQLAIIDWAGAYSCETPTYQVGRVEIGLLQLAPMPDGGFAMHLVAHGEEPFANGTGRFMAAGAVGDDVEFGHFAAQAGMSWAEAWVPIPRSAGAPFDVQVLNIRGEEMGTFTVRPSELRCDFS